MSNRHKEYPFKGVKSLDDGIQWDTQKQFELRQRIESSLNKKHKREKAVFRLLPMVGLVTALCIVSILIASYMYEEDLKSHGSAPNFVENTAEAALSVIEVLNESSTIHYVNLDITTGEECNFWLNNLHDSYNYKYKVYAPDGSLIGESTTAGSQERLYSVDLSLYGSGKYKIKVYTPAGNIGGKYHLRVRNF
ncbi:hypothetical protein [Cytobacillus sp. IB215665]|uniref:hypothetical protein n=1 Tax=Cytobacillus sp. IB215665 TaxID=3097357 RepID=UPI002A0B02A7|nr:hypothetical protein [Cytobacillus sp. IB215665]MDX8365162.1 hypothetical protein [Cytobacillus sp. IB215665]